MVIHMKGSTGLLVAAAIMLIVLIAFPAYRVFTPEALFEIVSRRRLHFDHTSQTGVVMHMISAVGDMGRVGLTAIADRAEEADALYRRFIAVLDEEARLALNG